MPQIIWGSNLEVGIAIIDAQHRVLVELNNRLDDAMVAGQGKTVLANILLELVNYTKTHFSTEERLMSE